MLNISKQIYSAWNLGIFKDQLPEAEIIPYGIAINEKKRLETITKKYTEIKEHDNIPLPGFTLYKTNRQRYGSADPTWLVIDPRGFLVRITNDNLEDILHVTGITEGLIQEKCVWARENTQTKMTLVPISSLTYIEAMQNTVLLEGKVNIKDVQIGDEVILQNNLSGTYMGVLSLYAPIDPYATIEKPQLFLRRQIVKVEDGRYFYQSDAKILKVTNKTNSPLTREESMALINEDISLGRTYFGNSSHMPAHGYYSSRGMIKHVSIHAIPKVSMTFEEITLDEAVNLFGKASLCSDPGMMVLETQAGEQYLIDFPFMSLKSASTISSFEAYRINRVKDGDLQITYPDTVKSKYSKTKELHTLDNFAKFYKIVKHVKDNTYI